MDYRPTLPQIVQKQHDSSSQDDNRKGRYAHSDCKDQYEAFVLAAHDVFKVPVAGGEGLAHLHDAVGLADRVGVQLAESLVELVEVFIYLGIDIGGD